MAKRDVVWFSIMRFSLKKLQEFVKRHKIFTVVSLGRQAFEASIARFYLHNKEIKSHQTYGCFGFYSDHEFECVECDIKDYCFLAGMGVNKSQYEKLLARKKPKKFLDEIEDLPKKRRFFDD